MRILVIEDDREAASYLVKALGEAGHVADNTSRFGSMRSTTMTSYSGADFSDITKATLRSRKRNATTALKEHLREVTDRMLAHEIERGAVLYRRERCLPDLVGADWNTLSEAAIKARLRRLIQRTVHAIQQGHGDINRLLALNQASRQRRVASELGAHGKGESNARIRSAPGPSSTRASPGG